MADINLTTTAVTPTGINIGTLRTRLRRELHDEDASNYRWPTSSSTVTSAAPSASSASSCRASRRRF